MLTYRKLTHEDLEPICAFPANEEELFCVSPKFRVGIEMFKKLGRA